MFNFHPNEGVVLFGIVQIILGISFIVMSYFDRKIKLLKEPTKHIQNFLLLIAGVILVVVFFTVDSYLELPDTEMGGKGLLKSVISWMAVVGLIYSFAIENSKVDKKLKRATLYTYLTENKISYFHLCMVVVGVIFIWLGYDSIIL